MMSKLQQPLFVLAFAGLFACSSPTAAQSRDGDTKDLNPTCEVGRDAQACLRQAIRLYEGKKLTKDDVGARRFAAKACAEGNAEGCNFLAAMLEKAIGGPADRPSAVRNYRRACSEGYANACYNLGQLFYREAASNDEVAEARALFARGCDAHIADSCNNHAVMLKFGEGGPRDLPGARARFDAACRGTATRAAPTTATC